MNVGEQSSMSFSGLIMRGLEKACPEGELSCYSWEASKAAVPAFVAVGIATAAVAATAGWWANRAWKMDVREHCQHLERRESYITAMTLALGTIGAALAVIFASSAAVSTALVIGVATAISLGANHWTHSRLIQQQKSHM